MNSSNLTFSEVMYLFSSKFVSEAGMLQNKEELPDGSKVSIVKLGNLLCESAFAYLHKNGFVDLKLEKKKTLGFIPTTKVTSTKRQANASGLSSLEKAIYERSDGSDAHMIMYRIIGNECAVPWAVMTGIVKKALVEKGFLIEEKVVKKILVEFVNYKYHLNSEKVAKESDLGELKSYLEEFSGNDFYKLLVKNINSGISAQKEQPDNDD